MILRRYRPDDIQALTDLFYDTVHNVNARDYTAEQLNAWASGQVDRNAWHRSFQAHVTVIAEEDGGIVGFGDMTEDGYLDRLYVHKKYLHRGIGSAICAALEGAVKSGLYETDASITAKPFFEKQGYRMIRKQQVIRNGVTLCNYRMRKGDSNGSGRQPPFPRQNKRSEACLIERGKEEAHDGTNEFRNRPERHRAENG